MGAHYGVPPRKLEDWDRRAQSLEGAAFYRPNGEVGAKFFELLGTRPAAGTLAGEGVPAAVLSYDAWQRRYRGAAGVIGSATRVGASDVRIAGVLPRNFWFLDLRPDVWIVSAAPGSVSVPALARLRTGFTAAQAQEELRALAAQVPPVSSGSAAVVEGLAAREARPWSALGIPWLAMVCGSAAAALVRFRRNPRYGLFLAAKIVLALGVVLLAAVEFGSSWMVIRGNDTNLGAGAVSLWLFLAAPAATLYWCWREQRRRCRHCLHRLALPVSFGEGARLLIERSGTELVCPYGHGTLFTSDGVEPAHQWSALDGSWRGLFAGK